MSYRPNVIWINCDELRWDAVGCSGNQLIQTPNIDRLAMRGALFENAYCASPVCSPARASLFSGLYPHAHGQYKNYTPSRKGVWGSHLPEEVVTIGDIFKGEGYTCGNVGVWHLGNDESPQHGFTDYWHTYRYLDRSVKDPFFQYIEELGLSNPYAKDAKGVFTYGNTLPCGVLTDPRQQRTTWTIDKSLEFLGADHDGPYFLLIGIKDPHPLILPPPELLALYPLEELPLPGNFHDPLIGKPAYQSRTKFRVDPETVSEREFRTLMRYYYALVTHIDNEVGRVIECLDRMGTLDNTIVVVNSDHGEMLGNHGFVEKCLMYEESVRVPCLISWPGGIPLGQRVAAPLGGVDMFPTLLELCGCQVPDPIDGRSFAADLCSGRPSEVMPVFAEIASDEAIYRGNDNHEQFAAHVMVRDDGWKYVWNRHDSDELYHLDTDPSEMVNLASDAFCMKRIKDMRRLITGMLEKTGPGLYDWCIRSK